MKQTFINIDLFKKTLNKQAQDAERGAVAREVKHQTSGVTDPVEIHVILENMVKQARDDQDWNLARAIQHWLGFLTLDDLKAYLPVNSIVSIEMYNEHKGHIYVYYRRDIICLDELMIQCLGWRRTKIQGKDALLFPYQYGGYCADTAEELSRALYGEPGHVLAHAVIKEPRVSL